MYEYQYHRARSVEHAVALANEYPEGKYLAGGQTLIQTMKLRMAAPTDLIDLGFVPELKGITADVRRVTIGATTPHAQVSHAPEIRQYIPALAHLASEIGDRQVRNRGTIGGSVANSDPAADYPAAVLGLGATIQTSQRSIAADDFFVALYETALEPNELLTSIEFPVPRRAGYVKFRSPASGFALVGVFVADFGDTVRVAVTGAGPMVFRIPEAEEALAEKFSADAIDAGSCAVREDDLSSDIQASAAYRAHLIPVLVRRAIEQATLVR
ncbi:MAG: FAD binding domain-containing protein [Pseudolabrys sp.]